MKHLKLFNESKTRDEIDELSDSCLSYLIDNGYKIFVSELYKVDNNWSNNIKVFFMKKDESNFKWDEIKYDFSTFLELIDSKYKIVGIHPIEISLSDPKWRDNGKATSPICSKFFTVEEFLNIDNLDDVNLDTLNVRYIEFKIKP